MSWRRRKKKKCIVFCISCTLGSTPSNEPSRMKKRSKVYTYKICIIAGTRKPVGMDFDGARRTTSHHHQHCLTRRDQYYLTIVSAFDSRSNKIKYRINGLMHGLEYHFLPFPLEPSLSVLSWAFYRNPF